MRCVAPTCKVEVAIVLHHDRDLWAVQAECQAGRQFWIVLQQAQQTQHMQVVSEGIVKHAQVTNI